MLDGPPVLSPRPGAPPAAEGTHVTYQKSLSAELEGGLELAEGFQPGLRFEISPFWQWLQGGDHGLPDPHRTAQHPSCCHTLFLAILKFKDSLGWAADTDRGRVRWRDRGSHIP